MGIEFYENRRGDCLVEDFINTLEIKHQKKIFNAIERLKKLGHQQFLETKDLVKKITAYKNLYELKIDYKKVYGRIFYSIIGRKIWLLCGFKKKTNKTPPQELKKADSIRKELSI